MHCITSLILYYHRNDNGRVELLSTAVRLRNLVMRGHMNDKIAASTETSGSQVLEFASLGLAAAADAIRSGDMTSESYASALLYQARAHADLNAFIAIDEDALLRAAKDADKA